MIKARFNPFPGLRSFELFEKHLFFGRESQTSEMLQRLGSTRFLAAVGPSGSGKSSLVRAGLVPELLGGANARAGSHWVVVMFRPGGDPMGALAMALAESELYAGQLEDGPAHVEATLSRSARGLIEAVRQAHPPPVTRVLVVVDQFEELFRFANAQPGHQDAADAFVRRLLEAATDPQERLYVVLTMRSDFIGDCARFPGLAEAINQGQYLIPRLNRDQWRSAIEGPIRVGGGTIAPRLVQRLLADVADDPDQLPVLQHALMRTWDYWERTCAGSDFANSPLDLPHYEAVGGMGEALLRHAEEALNELPEGSPRRIAERLFRALTEKGADGRGIRRPARFDQLLSACNASIAELSEVAAVFRKPGRTFVLPGGDSELTPTTVLDISHESLMRVWTRLRGWVDAEAQSARTYHRLAETAHLWQEGQAGLYRDPELALALRWQETDQPTEGWGRLQQGDFSLALRFLEASASTARREREAQEAARRQELERAQARAAEQSRRARIYAAIAVAMGVMVLLMFLAALWLRKLQREATARELTAHAVNQLRIDPELSVLLAAEAMRFAPLPVAEDVLRQALFASPVRLTLRGDGTSGLTEAVRISEFSPDGQRLLTAGTGSNVFLWDERGGLLALLRGHTAGITSADVSANGLAVTASDDGTARLWNVIDGRPAGILRSDSGSIRAAGFSRDGRQLVTASEDGTTRLWSGNQWTNVIVLPPQSPRGNAAVFSPTRNQVVTLAEGGGSRLWNLESPVSSAVLPNAPRNLIRGAFSADGQQLFALGAPSTPALTGWRLDGKLPVLEWSASLVSNAVSLATAHQEPRIVVAQRDPPRVATLWNSTNGTLMATLSGHGAGLRDAQFSPDDQLIVTASEDKTARIWSTKGVSLQELPGHQKLVNSAHFSPDGTRVATASDDGTSRIWAVLTGRKLSIARLPMDDIAFSTDGRWAAGLHNAGDGSRTFRRWPTESPETTDQVVSNMSHFAFSGDGTTSVLVGSEAVWIWDSIKRSSNAIPIRNRKAAVLALNHDGSLMLWSAASEGAQLWQLKPAARELGIRTPEGADSLPSMDTVAFSPDGRWLAGVNSRTNLLVWKLTMKPGPDRTVSTHLWGTISNANGIKSGLVDSLAFSPDSQALVCLIDGTSEIQRWDLLSPGSANPSWATREIAKGTVNRVTFSPDGRFLLAAMSDGTAGVLNAKNGYLIATLRGPGSALLRATFVRGTDAVVTVDTSGNVRSFNTEECGPKISMLELANRRVTRRLTQAEKVRYLP